MGNSFIKNQKADADAAYERLAITRKTFKEYQHAINETNTVDVAGEHAMLYAQVENLFARICLQEEMLINQGE